MNEAVAQDALSTGRVQGAKKFDATWKRFRNILTPHVPTLVLDAEGTIQYMTPAARRMLEYRAEQRVESCFFSHVHGRNLYQVMRDVADMVCYGKGQATWLLRLRTGQNRWQWFQAMTSNHLNAPEQVITIVLRDPHTA